MSTFKGQLDRAVYAALRPGAFAFAWLGRVLGRTWWAAKPTAKPAERLLRPLIRPIKRTLLALDRRTARRKLELAPLFAAIGNAEEADRLRAGAAKILDRNP